MKIFTLLLCVFLASTTMKTKAQFITNNGIAVSNSTTMSTNGDWTSDAGTTIINNGTISTTQSFINNGSLDPASTGGFELNFATDLIFKPGGPGMGFLIKDGPGGAAITGSIHITDSLLLKAGLLSPGAIDTVLLQEGALVTATPPSYVNGIVAHEGSGDKLFPVGTAGMYLPVTIYKVNAQKVTASVIIAPPGLTAGPGVDALIGFPYAWKVDEKISADTAAYVEVSYPTTLPVVIDPIIVRQADSSYVSMGARLIENTGDRVRIKSYSRGLKGIFSVAQGFPVDPATDSLALVALYDFTNGSGWTNNTNWTSGPVETWFGVTKTGQTITGISLPANNLSGIVPEQFVDILGLQTIDFGSNGITSIPDFTPNTEIISLDVSANKLTFGSLEPNAGITGLYYVDQAKFGAPVDSLVAVGLPYTFSVDAGGDSTRYQWKQNNVAVEGATSSTLSLDSIMRGNMGSYVAVATNPVLPALTLMSETQNVLAYAAISGTLYAENNVPATQGNMTLFRITPSAYDTIAVNDVSENGTFFFDKVVLDDYQLLGFADTLAHEGSIPTYYKNTIFWEEADTLFIEDNIDSITIVTTVEPGPPTGHGVISGYLEEDDGTGGRTEEPYAPKRVSGAGVSARRVENTGRGKEEEILTLVSYVFTNENGEFSLNNLPEGDYRLNIQYPGYPMDETSFITISIGTGFESQVSVEASVQEGMITVRKRTITGIYQRENYSAEVFPNPAVDYVHLKFAQENRSRNAVITDVNGRTVLRNTVPGKEEIINLESIGIGIYLLQILEHGRVVKTVRIAIE